MSTLLRLAASVMAGRSARERALLWLASGLAAIFALYAGIWQPLTTQRAEALARIERSDMAMARLAGLPPVSAQTPARPIRASDTPLNSLVTDSAEALGLTIRRLEPGAHSVSLTIDAAPFDIVIQWLDTLARDSGVVASDLDLERQPAPGVVRVRLTLSDAPT